MPRLVLTLAALALPSSILAQGTAGSATVPVRPAHGGLRPAEAAAVIGSALLLSAMLDDAVQEESQEWRNPTSNSIAGVGNAFGAGQYVFPALAAGWVTGVAFGRAELRTASGHALVAAAAGGLAVTVLKYSVGRLRPSSGYDADHFDSFNIEDSSFPSGHTALAFSVASSLSRDIHGRWDDVALYAAASLTGLARINDNRHWLSDVVGGAAIGIFAGKWATRGHRKVAAGPSGIGVSFEF